MCDQNPHKDVQAKGFDEVETKDHLRKVNSSQVPHASCDLVTSDRKSTLRGKTVSVVQKVLMACFVLQYPIPQGLFK